MFAQGIRHGNEFFSHIFVLRQLEVCNVSIKNGEEVVRDSENSKSLDCGTTTDDQTRD